MRTLFSAGASNSIRIISRVGQNHVYMRHIRFFADNHHHQTYGTYNQTYSIFCRWFIKHTVFFADVSTNIRYLKSNIQYILQTVNQTHGTFCRWIIKHTVFFADVSSNIRYFLQMFHQTYGIFLQMVYQTYGIFADVSSNIRYFLSNIRYFLQMFHQTYGIFCRWFIKHTVFLQMFHQTYGIIIKHPVSFADGSSNIRYSSSNIRYFLQMFHQTYGTFPEGAD